MVGTRLGVSVADIDECKYLVVWGPLLVDLEVAWSGDGCVLRVGGKTFSRCLGTITESGT